MTIEQKTIVFLCVLLVLILWHVGFFAAFRGPKRNRHTKRPIELGFREDRKFSDFNTQDKFNRQFGNSSKNWSWK